MARPETCSQCGRPLPAGTPAGFCPLCTLRDALEEERLAMEGVPASNDREGSVGDPSSVIGHRSPLTGDPWSIVMPNAFGDYEFLGEIARGGMGVVYRARQISLNRIVALKLMLPFSQPELAARFRAEAETAASLQHPNIVAIHEVGEHAGHLYFSMDYVEGSSLAQKISELGFRIVDFNRPARWLKTIAEAVHYAHTHGVLHRDLTPSNVLIDESDQPRISDFGLAKRLPGKSRVGNWKSELDLTLTGQVLGSPNFMAPEQAEGHHAHVGPACDIYSLGAMLYHALSGRPPFQGETLTEVLRQVVDTDPVAPRQLNPSIPRDLETICLKCLEKQPARRFGSAQALADELSRFLSGKPILSRPISPIGKAWRWCRARPVRTGLIAALLTVTLLGTAGVLWQWRQTGAALRKVEHAERDAVEKLWGSYLAQARANRWSGQAGRRYASLEFLRQAAAIRPSLELRNEAIACFALTDARVIQPWQMATGSVVVFDPDCERFACWNPPAGLTICRVADGTELLRLPGECGILPVKRLGFSPNGELLAVAVGGAESFRIQAWDLPRRDVRCEAVVEGSRQPMAFSPDSRLLLLGDTHGVLHVFDLVGKQKVNEIQVMRSPAQIVFDPGGTRIAVSGVLNCDVQVVDFDTGTILKTLPHPEPAGEPSWHPDGVLLATPCEDGRVRLWDVPSATVKTVLEGHTGAAKTVKFNHAGDLLASSGWDGVTRFWDPIMGKEQFSLPGGYLGLSSFNADDSRLPFGLHPLDVGLWEIADGRECRRLGLGGRAFGASISADGRLLVTAHADGARVWDLKAGRQRAFLPANQCRSVLFHPDGQSLVLCGWMGLQQWPVQTMEDPDKLTLCVGPPQTLVNTVLEQARWTLDGRALAVTGPEGFQRLELGVPLRVLHRSDHPKATFISLSDDGHWVATGTWKGQGVRVWDADTGSLVTNLSVGFNVSVAFSPQSRWLVTGAPQEYRFWKVGSWEIAHAIPRENAGDMYGSMVFSPDGRTLALVRGRNSDLRLVEADTGRECAALDAGEPLCFSSCGSRLVTSEANGLLRLWDLRRIRQQLASMNLDWDALRGDPDPPFASEKPLSIVVELESRVVGQ